MGVREGSGDAVLVPADALVLDRVFEAALVDHLFSKFRWYVEFEIYFD